MLRYQIPGLAAAITLFVRNRLSLPRRDDYARASLPIAFASLDIWPHVKCYSPPLNMFYDSRTSFIRCTLATAKRAGVFDPVLVEIAPQRMGMDRECYV